MTDFNIYCDESCYLEHDECNVMVLGALTCPKEMSDFAFNRIRDIKRKHGINVKAEIKWNKVSNNKYAFYRELVDFYFDIPDLNFRALVIPDKSILDHEKHKQTHDDFYYKMYFELLKVLFNPDSCYNIYLDIKDTYGGVRTKRLHQVLSSTIYDLKKEIVKQIQVYPSDQIELIQLTDLFVGAIGYHHRGLSGNLGKVKTIKRIQERSKYSLSRTPLLKEQKMNLLIWESSDN